MSECVQYVEGGKWHRVWWLPEWEDRAVMVSHTNVAYDPDRHELRPATSVAVSDRCRTCFPGEGSATEGGRK